MEQSIGFPIRNPDRILLPIGFPVGFLSSFRSDHMVFDRIFRSEILSEFRAGPCLKFQENRGRTSTP